METSLIDLILETTQTLKLIVHIDDVVFLFHLCRELTFMSHPYIFLFLLQSELLKVSLSRECWTMTRLFVWFSISLRSSSSVDWKSLTLQSLVTSHNFTPQFDCTISVITPGKLWGFMVNAKIVQNLLQDFYINVCLHSVQSMSRSNLKGDVSSHWLLSACHTTLFWTGNTVSN